MIILLGYWVGAGIMFNNINENNRELLYGSQMNPNNVIDISRIRSSYNRNTKNPYVDKTEISASAMELFQKDLDINKFTQIAISDPDDKSYLKRMKALFAEGVIDAYEDDVISELAINSRLLKDLED